MSKNDPHAVVEAAPWPAVAFVCTRCEGRKGAPKSLDAKRLGQKLREGFRDAKLRTRVVGAGCMGLCPRGAIAAAVSVKGGPVSVIEVRRKRDAQAVVERLTAPEFPLEPT
jgi:predicted metal-binding protein